MVWRLAKRGLRVSDKEIKLQGHPDDLISPEIGQAKANWQPDHDQQFH
jgi:hypothetical protein